MSEQAQIHSSRQTAMARPRNWPQLVIATGVIVAFCYFAEWELAVLLISVLIAFMLAPVVDLLQRFRLPRSVASLTAVFLLVVALYAVMYFSYNETMSFLDNLPKYSSKIRSILIHVRQSAERLQQTTETVFSPEKDEKSPSAPSRQAPVWNDILFRGFGSISQAFLPLSFVPFLVYFMLTWEHHARSATVMLFSMENRHVAYTTLGLISQMIRSFLVGNFLVGCFIAGISTVVFGLVGLPSFFVVGVVSGFVSLIPYLGVLLALIVPVVVALGQLGPTELVIIVVTVVTLHLVGINVLYPKFLGSRLQLNPLAVTIALLFWGRLWGAIGLVLAIPITGAMKIIFDHIESLQAYGTWLGE